MNISVGKTCPYCQHPIKPGVNITTCAKCGIPHHADCWDHNGGCTTFGCTGARAQGAGSQHMAAAPLVIDLSNIMNEPEPVPMAGTPPQVTADSAGNEAAIVSASKTMGQVGGVLGAIVGFVLGLNAGGIGCIPGALVGYILGWMVGSVVLYLLVLSVPTALGCVLLSSAGDEAMFVGGVIGFIVGIGILTGLCKPNNGEGNGG